MTGPMEDVVNVHVLDHLVNGPVAHRELMDAAKSQDALLAELLAALEDVSNEVDEFDDHDGRLGHLPYVTVVRIRAIVAKARVS